MKKLLISIVALTIAGCAIAQAGDSYDANGRLIHRSVTHGNITRSYTSDGRPFAILYRQNRQQFRGNVRY